MMKCFTDFIFLPELDKRFKSQRICTDKVKELKEFEMIKWRKKCGRFAYRLKKSSGTSEIGELANLFGFEYDTLLSSHEMNKIKERYKVDSTYLSSIGTFIKFKFYDKEDYLDGVIVYLNNKILVSTKCFTFLIQGKFDLSPSLIFYDVLKFSKSFRIERISSGELFERSKFLN